MGVAHIGQTIHHSQKIRAGIEFWGQKNPISIPHMSIFHKNRIFNFSAFRKKERGHFGFSWIFLGSLVLPTFIGDTRDPIGHISEEIVWLQFFSQFAILYG